MLKTIRKLAMGDVIEIKPFYDPDNYDQPVEVEVNAHRSGHLFVTVTRGGRKASSFYLSKDDVEHIGGEEEVKMLIEHGICNVRCDFLLLIDPHHQCDLCPEIFT